MTLVDANMLITKTNSHSVFPLIMLSFWDKTKQKKEKMRTTVLFEKKEVSHKFRLRINTAL